VELCPMSLSEVVLLLAGLGRALERARAYGLTHGALKPTNVFVGPAPAYVVRVTDFGASLVRAALANPDANARASRWLAPEQADGGGAAGAHTDVFSAALVAFFAATGRSLWRAPAADLQAWKSELHGARASVSARAADHGVTLPIALDAVFARALAVHPA